VTGRGFWTGLLVGLLTGLAGVVVLALINPPVVSNPPTLAPDAMEGPSGMTAPGKPQPPDGPRESGSLFRPGAAPLIDGTPSAEAPPPLPGHAARGSEE
jgi:hypothetical protein